MFRIVEDVGTCYFNKKNSISRLRKDEYLISDDQKITEVVGVPIHDPFTKMAYRKEKEAGQHICDLLNDGKLFEVFDLMKEW